MIIIKWLFKIIHIYVEYSMMIKDNQSNFKIILGTASKPTWLDQPKQEYPTFGVRGRSKVIHYIV